MAGGAKKNSEPSTHSSGGGSDSDDVAGPSNHKKKTLDKLRRDLRNLVRLKGQVIHSIRADITKSGELIRLC